MKYPTLKLGLLKQQKFTAQGRERRIAASLEALDALSPTKLTAAQWIEIAEEVDDGGKLAMELPDIETVAAEAHNAWMQSKLATGFTSRKSESGEELMQPYSQLSEQAKDLDRNMVKAVYSAIRAAKS